MAISSGNGDIKLSVGLDSTNARDEAKNLANEVKQVFDKATNQKSASLTNMEVQLKKSSQEAEKLIKEMDELASTQIPTQQYTQLQSELDKSEKSARAVIERMKMFEEDGGDLGSKTYKKMTRQLEYAEVKSKDLSDEMQKIVSEGKAFTLGRDSAEYAALEQKLGNINDKLKVQLIRHREATNQINKQSIAAIKLKNNLATASKQSQNMGKNISSMTIPFKGLTKMVLKYALGIRSVYILVRKLRQALIDGFKNLAQFNNGNNAVNKTLSELNSSLSQLKNNFAAAFAPILTTIGPMLNQLITWINQAVEAMGRLIAMLSGQSTFIRAKKIQQDYAKSLDKTAGAAKNASKQLAGFDKLNTLSSNKGGGGSDANSMFEEVPIKNNLEDFLNSDLIQKIKNRLKELWDYFKKGFFDALGDVSDRMATIKNGLKTISDALIDIFTDPAVIGAMNNWLNSLAHMLGAFSGMITSMGLTIAANLIGGLAKYLGDEANIERIKSHLVTMFDVRTEINDQFADFFIAFADFFEVFASDEGQRVTAAFIGMYADAFMGVEELVSKATRDILTLITQPFIDNKDDIKQAVYDALGVLATVLEETKKVVDDTSDSINGLYDNHVKPLMNDLTTSLSNFVKIFLDTYNKNIKPTWDLITKNISEFVGLYVTPLVKDITTEIGLVMDLIKLLWNNVLAPFLGWWEKVLVTGFLSALQVLVAAFKFLWANISTIISFIIMGFNGLLSFIKDIFTQDWNTAWNNLLSNFSDIQDAMLKKIYGILNSAIDIINSFINYVQNGINSVIGGLNGVIEKANGIPGFNVPSIPELNIKYRIPHLATGGVVPPNKEFMAMLGDNKTEEEVVSPLSTMKQAFLEALQESGMSGGGGDIRVDVDGDTLFTIVRKHDSQYKNMHGGKSAFAY